SAPADGAVLAAPPARVTLEFNESLNPTSTTIVVTDAGAEPVPSSEPEVSGPRGSVTFTQPLADGTYTVAYRVVSRDGHPVQGAFTFTVGEPAPSSATPPATTAPSGPARAEGESSTGPARADPRTSHSRWRAGPTGWRTASSPATAARCRGRSRSPSANRRHPPPRRRPPPHPAARPALRASHPPVRPPARSCSPRWGRWPCSSPAGLGCGRDAERGNDERAHPCQAALTIRAVVAGRPRTRRRTGNQAGCRYSGRSSPGTRPGQSRPNLGRAGTPHARAATRARARTCR